MKYLQRRDDFLQLKNIDIENEDTIKLFKSSEMIRETFENDITWGGSLVGRLINSVIRYSKILVQAQRIKSIIPQIERCLNELLAIAVFDEDQRKKIALVTVQFLLEEIIKVVKSNLSVQVKITQLAGDENGEGGLIDNVIKKLEESVDETDFPDKNDVIAKLKKFKEELLKLRGDETPEEEEESDDEEPSSNFKEEITEFLKSILDLFNFFKKSPEGEKKTKLTWKGKEVIIVSKGNKKLGAGDDQTWNTTDDEFDGNPPKKIVPPGSIQVIVKNPVTNKFDKDSEIAIVKPTELKKESLLVENLTPEVEKQVQNAKSKIQKAFKFSEMGKYESLFTKLLNDCESGNEVSIGYAKEIMKQVFKNEITEGKPISFEELIKEAAEPFFKTEYKVLPKVISLLGRVLMSLKDSIEFTGNFGDLSGHIKSFVEGYTKIKETLKSESEEKENVEVSEEGAGETTAGEKSITTTQSQTEKFNYKPIFEKDEPGKIGDALDKVMEAWRNNITVEEEKKWSVDKTLAKKLENDGKKAENSKLTIDISKKENFDYIVEIADLFGKAYKMYATNWIPSGRPGGIISLSTLREYKYIGDETTSRSDWGRDKGDGNPGEGPWAALKVYKKFEDGIMGLLKNNQYRKILANSRFKNSGPNQAEGSGKTLFKFMNNMLSGIKGDYDKNRHELFAEYFGQEGSDRAEFKPVGGGGNNDILPGNQGEKGSVSFLKGTTGITLADVRESGQYNKSFGYVEGVINGKTDQKMIIYFNSVVKIDKKMFLFCRVHLSKNNKQSLVSSYLKKTMEDKKLKLDKSLPENVNELVYFLPIEMDGSKKYFRKGVELNLKCINIKKLETDEPITLKIKPTKDIFILGYVDENKDGKQTQKVLSLDGEPFRNPSGDLKINLAQKFKDKESLRKKFGMQ